MPPVVQFRPSPRSCAARRGAVPCSLDLMLMDGVLERIARARRDMEQGESQEKHQLLVAAVNIVGELRSSLDLLHGGPFAVNLDDLCDYMSRQLVAANQHNRVATLDEVSHLLREIRYAWVMLPPEARATPAGERRE